MSRRMLVDKLYHARFRGDKELRKIIDSPGPLPRRPQDRRPSRGPKYIKGVHKGNFFKIKLPPKKNNFPDVPKLPPVNPPPKAFVPSNRLPPSQEEIRLAVDGVSQTLSKRALKWARANWAVLVLNFGSICSLIGFTRSDILDLRCLSMVGSISGVCYVLVQDRILWPSVIWSSLFATVNSFKIYQILQERNADVHMNDEEEAMFVRHFMGHGITPRQFERILKRAKRVPIKKGEYLVRKGEPLSNVFLVVEGSTRAHVLGRHLTAASTGPLTKSAKQEGGDSGAWIGEMAFLDYYWDKQQGKNKDDKEGRHSIYTIFAHTDCMALGWSHEDMEALMASSTDLRAALTRAMTSAVVGKVVNMTISRTNKVLPNWSMWLSDWRNDEGATVQVRSLQRLPEDTDEARAAENAAASVEDNQTSLDLP